MKTQQMIGLGVVVILAIGLITLAGYETTQKPASSSTLGVTGASSTAASTSTGSMSAASSGSSSSQSQGVQGTGDFAVWATDPPVVASGVTAATATYDSLAVHTAGDSNSTGWVKLNATGTINLMSSANVSQTIASAKIQSGAYDIMRMGIKSATVTYHNQVYAATVASSNLTSKLQSQAQVSSTQSAAAIVDMRTFIINAANSSQPEFVFSACAKSTAVPPSQVTSTDTQVGSQTNLQGNWWVGFNDQTSTNVTITSTTLTSGSLDLQMKNTGNDTAHIQTIIITPVSSTTSLGVETMPASLAGSAVFTVGGSDSVQASNSLQAAALLGGNGTQCNAGSSTSLSYSGIISLGFGTVGLQLTGIIPGQQYVVTVMGANTYGSAVVTAQ